MHDIAQIAVVRGRRVAHHRIDLRRADDRQLGAGVEPHRGLRLAAALLRHVADDRGRFDAAPIAALAIVLAISIAA